MYCTLCCLPIFLTQNPNKIFRLLRNDFWTCDLIRVRLNYTNHHQLTPTTTNHHQLMNLSFLHFSIKYDVSLAVFKAIKLSTGGYSTMKLKNYTNLQNLKLENYTNLRKNSKTLKIGFKWLLWCKNMSVNFFKTVRLPTVG